MPISINDLRKSPGYLLRRANQISLAVAAEQLMPHKLTAVQFASLVAIDECPGLDATRLSVQINFDRATLTGVIDRLEAKNLLVRKPDPNDRRMRLLYVTTLGAQVLRDASKAARQTKDDILEPLPRAERKQLLTLLDKFVSLHEKRLSAAVDDPEKDAG